MATLYEKVGKRYKPVADTEAYSGLHNGSWLVIVEHGRRSASRLLDPQYAEVYAALEPLIDELAKLLSQSSSYTPTQRTMTPREKRAYKAYTDIMGKDAVLWLQRPSAYDIADRAVKSLAPKIKQLVENQNARKPRSD